MVYYIHLSNSVYNYGAVPKYVKKKKAEEI